MVAMAPVRKKYSGELAVAVMRLSSIAVGPLAALAVASRLSLVEQGYYYTFVSILAARAAFDAGVAQVIVNTTGQERGDLVVDRKAGLIGSTEALSGVRDVFHFALMWYSIAAVAMLAVVGGVGYYFFSSGPPTDVAWQWPWISFVLLGCLDFAGLGIWAVLEGLNEIVHVYVMRSIKTFASVFALAGLIFAGAGLWGVVGFMAATVAVDAVLIITRRRVLSTLAKAAGGALQWRKDIWPFQWRMAVSWVGGYLAVPLFVPMLFRTNGAAEAGRVGMTMAVLNAATSLAQAVIDAKVPFFCGLIASKSWRELDIWYLRRTLVSLALLVIGQIAAVLVILLLERLGVNFTARIVAWPVFAVFAGATAGSYVVQLEATYLRCHRQEPLMWMSVICGLLMAPVTYFMAKTMGGGGVGLGFLLVTLLYSLPVATWILIRSRKVWHAPTS